ncbi:hypothetical protein FB451DRAFT_1295834, partial [Mycena latifolia]
MGTAGTRWRYAASSTAGAQLGLLLGCRRGRRGLRSLGDRRHRLAERNGPRRLLRLVGERAGVAAVRHEHRGHVAFAFGCWDDFRLRGGNRLGGRCGSLDAAGGSAIEGSGAGDSAACSFDTLWRRRRAEMQRDAGVTSTRWGRITIRPEVREWSKLDARGCRWHWRCRRRGVPVVESEQSL